MNGKKRNGRCLDTPVVKTVEKKSLKNKGRQRQTYTKLLLTRYGVFQELQHVTLPVLISTRALKRASWCSESFSAHMS